MSQDQRQDLALGLCTPRPGLFLCILLNSPHPQPKKVGLS